MSDESLYIDHREPRIHVIIPARLESKRLPRKPLLSETGKPLIQHTWEAATAFTAEITRLDPLHPAAVCIATDSGEIIQAAAAFGAETVVTSSRHKNGTSRIIEAVESLGIPFDDIVINLQADEPETVPGDLQLLVDVLRACEGRVRIATLASTAITNFELYSHDRVKVAVGNRWAVNTEFDGSFGSTPAAGLSLACAYREMGKAYYFSRAAIRGALLHLGIYAFRAGVLRAIAHDIKGSPASPPLKHPLSDAENLEQLSWMEGGHSIAVGITSSPAAGIDTPLDYQRFVERTMRDVELDVEFGQ